MKASQAPPRDHHQRPSSRMGTILGVWETPERPYKRTLGAPRPLGDPRGRNQRKGDRQITGISGFGTILRPLVSTSKKGDARCYTSAAAAPLLV